MSALPKSLERLLRDPRVEDAWSERGLGDGYWVSLRPGWGFPVAGTHTIHEYTVRGVRDEMRRVERCGCAECTGAKP